MRQAAALTSTARERSALSGRILPRRFYEGSALDVAKRSIGKLLVRRHPEGLTIGRIVETEAYRGPEDRAAHSFGGRRTARTEVMYGAAGHAYVFFVYGMHWHFNIVAGKLGKPEAVLVRAVEPVDGAELMSARRGTDATSPNLTNGPGKLCQAFAIDGRDYGLDLTGNETLYLAEGKSPSRIARSPRIGIDYAGSWALRPWRFFDPDSRFVSSPRPSRQSA
jgi:DNA-3-methyladenine glycosylase